MAKAELDMFERNLRQQYWIRGFAGGLGLVMCALLYVSGIAAAAVFLGLCPYLPAAKPDMWHIVVATLAALFTVPTVILLAVLRTVAVEKKDEGMPTSVHEALGQMLTKIVDKLTDLIGGKP